VLIEMFNEPQSSRPGSLLCLMLSCKQWKQRRHPIEQRFLAIIIEDDVLPKNASGVR